MLSQVKMLYHLLDYLPIRPGTDLMVLNEIVKGDERVNLTQSFLDKIHQTRKNIYRSMDFRQTGLFEFYVGLLMMEFGWFSQAAECFRKAKNEWGFLPVKPLLYLCLTNFAKGVAFHHSNQPDLASMIYSEVEEQLSEIRNTFQNNPKYQKFANDLQDQLTKAQGRIQADIYHQESINDAGKGPDFPSVKKNSSKGQPRDQSLSNPNRSKRFYSQIRPDKIQQFIFDYFNMSELQDLCFALEIKFESLSGDTLNDKARELVAYCSRRGEKNKLINMLEEKRKDLFYEFFDTRSKKNGQNSYTNT